MNEQRTAMIAAALILIIFGIAGFLMPRIMLTVGEFSTTIAGLLAALFVVAFFLVFWLRAQWQKRKGR